MRAKELRGLSEEELKTKLEILRKQLFDLNFQARYGKVEKPHIFRATKRDIARILTILREREDERKKEDI